MAKWFPSPEETFVFRNRRTHQGVTILVPGGQEPRSVIINGDIFIPDEELTFRARGHIRAAYERRENGSTE